MIVKTLIEFSREEKRAISNTTKAIHHFVGMTVDEQGAIRRSTDGFAVDLQTLQTTLETLRRCKTKLMEETHLRADPVWVASSKQARAEGKEGLIVADPEKAVAGLCETRQQQVEEVENIEVLLIQAISLIPLGSSLGSDRH